MYLVGKVLKPQGIKGELKIEIITSYPDHFTELDQLYIGDYNQRQTYQIESVRFAGRFVYIKFLEIRSRNEAELLRGAELFIDDSELRDPQDNEFYIHDLLGIEVFNENNRLIGKILRVETYSANDIYVIQTPDEKEVMIPAVREFVKNVYPDENKMVIREIDGLLE